MSEKDSVEFNINWLQRYIALKGFKGEVQSFNILFICVFDVCKHQIWEKTSGSQSLKSPADSESGEFIVL